MDREALVLEAELKLNLETANQRVKLLEQNLKTLIEQRNRLMGMGQSTKAVEANIRSTAEALKLAKENADKSRDALVKLGSEGGESLKDMDGMAGKLAGTLGTLFSLKMAKDFASRIVSTRSEFQQLEVAFTTLLKSEEKANKLMSDAVDLAAKTPFDLQGVANGARQLIAYGFAADEVIEDMRRLGDVAAGLGLPLQRLTYLYGTTRVQGRLYSRDMLQFTNSGIPMLDQLAKMYGKTTKEINEMVSAGKIGFEDIKKAIYAMTNEGGQFANLMEKQSKTIGGQISNIGDSLDQMFNELGKKSEGVINSALSGVSWLVENYEKVGKVLGVVIAAYGAERAALMVTAALRKTTTRLTIQETLAKAANTAATRGAATAQMALNKAILSNPYVLAAAAVVGLTVALVKLTKQSSLVADQQKAMNDMANKIDESTTKEIANLDRLNGKLKGAEKGTDAWNKAKAEAVNKYGAYFKNLDAEITKTGTLASAYDTLKKSILAATKVRMMDSFVGVQADNVTKQVNAAIDSFEKKVNKQFKKNPEIAGELTSQYSNYLTGGRMTAGLKQTLMNVDNGFNNLLANSKDIRSAFIGLGDLEKRAMKRFGISEKELESIRNNSTGEVTNPTPDNGPSQEEIDKARKAAQKEYQLKKNREALNQKAEREFTQMELDEEQRRIDLMSDGYSKERAQNELNFNKEMLQIRQQREDKLKEYQKESLAEWKEKNPDKLDYEYQNEVTSLTDEENAMFNKKEEDALDKWAAANAEAYRRMVEEYGDAKERMAVLGLEWDEKIEAEEDASVRRRMELQKNLALAQAGEEYANNGGSFTERYDALKNRLDAELALADDAHKEMKRKMNDLALAEFTLGENQEYGDVLNDVVPALKARWEALMATLPENLQAGSGRAADETMAALAEQFASSVQDADFTKWYNDLGGKSLKALEKELERTQTILETESGAGGDAQALAKAELEVAALKKRIQELTNAQKTSNINWKEAADVINEAVSTFDTLGETIGGVAGEAISSLGGVVSATAGVVNGINAISDAMSAAEKSVAILAVISAAIKVVQKVASIAKANKEANDAAAESARQYAQALEDLNDAARLDNLKNAFGTDGFATFKEAQKIADEARRAGRALSMGGKTLVADMRSGWQKFWGSDKNKETASIASFYGKDGNLDVEKLKAWNEQYGESLSDTQKKLVDDLINEWERYESAMEEVNGYLESLFGDTASSIAEAMVDAFMESGDALADLTDISNNFGKSLAKSMVTSTLMESVFTDEAQKRIKDMLLNGNTAGAVNAYNKLLDDANAKAPEITEFLRGLNLEMGGEADERSGESKGIAQASQDSVDELNGRATVIQSHTFQINENVKAIQLQNAALVANASDILNEVRGIHDDTGFIKGQMATVVAQQQKINSNVEWIIDKGVRAN